MKTDLRRSKTYWFGILVMVFIAWAWIDSLSHVTAWNWHGGSSRSVSIRHVAGRLSLENATNPAPGAHAMLTVIYPAGLHRSGYTPTGPPTTDQWLPYDHLLPTRETFKLYANANSDGSVDTWIWKIPHWLLLLLTAITWGLMLRWRKKRRERAGANLLDHQLPQL